MKKSQNTGRHPNIVSIRKKRVKFRIAPLTEKPTYSELLHNIAAHHDVGLAPLLVVDERFKNRLKRQFDKEDYIFDYKLYAYDFTKDKCTFQVRITKRHLKNVKVLQ